MLPGGPCSRHTASQWPILEQHWFPTRLRLRCSDLQHGDAPGSRARQLSCCQRELHPVQCKAWTFWSKRFLSKRFFTNFQVCNRYFFTSKMPLLQIQKGDMRGCPVLMSSSFLLWFYSKLGTLLGVQCNTSFHQWINTAPRIYQINRVLMKCTLSCDKWVVRGDHWVRLLTELFATGVSPNLNFNQNRHQIFIKTLLIRMGLRREVE